jgi:hypothetical protein
MSVRRFLRCDERSKVRVLQGDRCKDTFDIGLTNGARTDDGARVAKNVTFAAC